MSYASLMACLHVDRSNADLLGVVAAVARIFGSRVIGLAAKQASAHAYPRGAGLLEPHEHDLHRFGERAAAAETEFRAILSKLGELEWRSKLTFGPAYEFVANESRASDLVLASIDPSEHSLFPSGHADAGDLMMRLGRPVLAVPAGVSELALNAALVCWKDSREARRAAADALPILKATKRVDVVKIAADGRLDEARRGLAEVGEWLSRHGVKAHCTVERASGSEGSQLIAIAKSLHADLIIAGAFGHSRLREWTFGGVTRDLLLGADRCFLGSH